MSKAIKNYSVIHLKDVPEIRSYINEFLKGYEFEYIGSFGKKETSSDVDVIVKATYNDFKHIPDAVHSPGFNLLSVPISFRGLTLQLDLFYTNDMEWARFIFSGNKQRNQLLMAHIIAHSKVWLEEDTYKQFNIRLPSGLWGVTKTFISETGRRLKNPRILTEYFVTSNPKVICERLGLDYERTLTFEGLWEQLKDDKLTINKYNEYQ